MTAAKKLLRQEVFRVLIIHENSVKSNMNDYLEKALAKLSEGVKADCGRHGNAMKKEVAKALEDFCRQDAEFAQAVAQGGEFKIVWQLLKKA